ncbi:MAG: efflux RND transporter periplasmic adaptor subunit [Herminiimonas sp.]|nr:efflux RND transporter periplasmic adaptor subunit [Herminiimonas sp.]
MSTSHPSIPSAVRVLLMSLLLSVIAACGDKPAASAGGPPPPAEVGIVTVAPTRIALTTELPGRVEASRVAQVRARVPGIVLKRSFREGSEVKAGEILFRIDPAPLQATFSSTEAAVAKADANLAQATLKTQRYKPLVETNAISRQEYDDALTAQKQATADLATARATRQSAGLNLGYATVTAPIAGRIGRAQVTEGALVGQGEATPLATVQQIDPIFVNLTQSSTELLRLRRAMDSGKLQSAGQNAARVTLVTEDGQVYPQTGKLLFSDLTVDESSGAVTLRAEFSNPNRTLLPGMYVRARLEQAVNDAALTVPTQAVQRTTDGASVMVVGPDNKVAARPVKADTAQGNVWIVSAGLKPGDRVIVEGLQKAKPGATVKTVNWAGVTPPAGTAPLAPPAVASSASTVSTAPAPAPSAAAAPSKAN